MEHLVANSGIQFIVKEVEFNATEPFILPNGKTLKYTFCDVMDFLTNNRKFDVLVHNVNEGVLVPLQELEERGKLEKLPDGEIYYDTTGLPAMDGTDALVHYSYFNEGDADIFGINTLSAFRVRSSDDSRAMVSAFSLLLNKWLPMPMFELEPTGYSQCAPYAWARVRIEDIGEGRAKASRRYRFTWAFDTETSDDDIFSNLRPSFQDDKKMKQFSLCNKVFNMLGFMSTNTSHFSSFSEYIASLLGVDKNESYKYIGFYIYFVNYIRLIGASPEVTLHNADEDTIPVDLVLDIGNSRTCGVLFERGEFTKSMMLDIRNLSQPHLTSDRPFDMRFAFRKADFGNDIYLPGDFFTWKSFVRVGEEAQKLVYRSLEEEGLKARTTNYSSPKRYLWDEKKYDGKWEFLITEDDPSNVALASNIFVPIMSDLFDASGNYIGNSSDENIEYTDGNTCYSRSSLMTFVLIEVFQQAITFINSPKFREKHGDIDCKRVLKNVVLTCPTAMPIKEQIKLRQCAVDAFDAIMKCTKVEPVNIEPNVNKLKVLDKYAPVEHRTWTYDEASCCQLVYLYAESEKYRGEMGRFFDMKGHVRPELVADGYEGKVLTIASVDIGAGTTDVMICSYALNGKGNNNITPIPLWWDSYYLAGDDILRNIIQNVIIEGDDKGLEDMGNIASALTARLMNMSDSDLRSLPCVKNVSVYAAKVEDIVRIQDPELKNDRKRALASNIVRDFFGCDSAMNGYKDRRCRVDFNTQISHPMSQQFLDFLRVKRPSKVYTYDELFTTIKPAQYLLDYFADHFGFRFEELSWRFDPAEIADIVKSTMEPLMRQLSEVLYRYNCDVLLLAGRPTTLDAITDLFVKYVPVPLHNQIRVNEYRVGQWFPFADGQGYLYDQKATVAVGAMVGFLASQKGFNGITLDMSEMIKRMESNVNYIGMYNSERQQIKKSFLSPEKSSATIEVSEFPAFIGCRQYDSQQYQARPIFALYNRSHPSTLRIMLSRSYFENKEVIFIEEVSDMQGNSLNRNSVELVQQSLVNDGRYWLDKGEFELAIK